MAKRTTRKALVEGAASSSPSTGRAGPWAAKGSMQQRSLSDPGLASKIHRGRFAADEHLRAMERHARADFGPAEQTRIVRLPLIVDEEVLEEAA